MALGLQIRKKYHNLKSNLFLLLYSSDSVQFRFNNNLKASSFICHSFNLMKGLLSLSVHKLNTLTTLFLLINCLNVFFSKACPVLEAKVMACVCATRNAEFIHYPLPTSSSSLKMAYDRSCSTADNLSPMMFVSGIEPKP